MGDYVAPARRLYTGAHKPDGDRTVCGLDTTDPEELWQPVTDPESVCTACMLPDQTHEEPTLI